MSIGLLVDMAFWTFKTIISWFFFFFLCVVLQYKIKRVLKNTSLPLHFDILCAVNLSFIQRLQKLSSVSF